MHDGSAVYNRCNIALVHSARLGEVDDQIINMKDFVLVRDEQEAIALKCSALLFWQEDKLSLQTLDDRQFKPLAIDWALGKSGYRRLHGGRGEMIAKAVGVKQSLLPTVIDSTAGLGHDSFVLAAIGCSVIMIERSHVVRALLWDGLRRASEAHTITAIAQRMKLVPGESVVQLKKMSLNDSPDVVYCDPMFPERNKSALVRKEMRVFKDIVGADHDAADLLEQALNTAKKRVVVKRPRKAPTVDGPPPSHCIEGRACRFDVYMLT